VIYSLHMPKKFIPLLALLVVLIVIIVAVRGVPEPTTNNNEQKETVTESPVSEKTSPEPVGKNTSFTLDGKLITLTNGLHEAPGAPGSAAKVVTRYFGNGVSGDLNGDGYTDEAFLVTQEGAGSGTFFYAVVALKKDDGYVGTNAFFIGDRIAPQNMYIPGGTRELHVNYAERKVGEPMTARASQGAVTLLKVTGQTLEGLMK
jgi:hypothetical protein